MHGSDQNILLVFFRISRAFGDIENSWRYLGKNGTFDVLRAFSVVVLVSCQHPLTLECPRGGGGGVRGQMDPP